jgi:hypothetical protein
MDPTDHLYPLTRFVPLQGVDVAAGPTHGDDGDDLELDPPSWTPKRDADAANLRTLAAYTAVLGFVILLLISPALVIGTWKALV